MANIPPADIERARNRLVETVKPVVALTKKDGLLVGICPFHREKTGSFTVYSDHFHCFGCGAHGDAIQFARDLRGLEFADAVRWILGSDLGSATPVKSGKQTWEPDQDAERKQQAALAIWQNAQAPENTPVETYLRGRGITLDIPASIKYAPDLKHGPTGMLMPAMVAAIQGPDRAVTGIHRTYLVSDGSKKAFITQGKMMLGRCATGAVRLAAVAESLILAEGIETALSVMQATSKPTWACLSTSGLKTAVLPRQVREVVIAADGDEPGEKAAQDAAQRFLAEGRKVKIARAPKNMDFNDVLMLPENVTPLDLRRRQHG